MIHQVIELSYRTAELLVIGREKISHSIRNHQKLMKPYVPEFAAVFNEDDEEEMNLLNLLDDAYRSVRYEHTYVIDREQFLFFIEKADVLEKLIAEVYKITVFQFERNCLSNKALSIPGSEEIEAPVVKNEAIEKSIKPLKRSICVQFFFCYPFAIVLLFFCYLFAQTIKRQKNSIINRK